MLRSKQQFVKVTKKGSLVKVVREHYLRDDIPCGIANCPECLNLEGYKPVIDPSLPILLIDTNLVLHQTDILENPSITNVYLCSTVLEETRHRNRSAYERIRSLTQQESKRFFVFSNEHHQQTFVPQQPTKAAGEDSQPFFASVNDRNDMAIRNVFKWLLQHAKSRVIFISDDAANRQLAKEQIPNGEIFSMQQFLQSFYPDLLDQLSLDHFDEGTKFVRYPEYLDPSVVQLGIEKKIYFSGTFNVSSYNVLEGSILSEVFGREIIIQGRERMNRAIHGDQVAIELLPQDQWKSQDEEMVVEEADENAQESNAVDTKDSDEMQQKKQKNSINLIPTGKVVAVLKKKWRAYCGTIRETGTISLQSSNMQTVLFVPVDRRIPVIRIQTRQLAAISNKRIIVTIDAWPATSKFPLGHYRQTVGSGELGTLGTETEVILIEHDVPYEPFPPVVLDCLPAAGSDWKPSERDYQERADFRDLLVCSIDPPGCTDIDDALHARPIDPFNPQGSWEVGVHIADVTHFVSPGTAMDEEAARRATTVYLVDRRIDMLPELLGSNLCSLHSNQERLAFSVLWRISPEGKIEDCWFTRSIIQSKRSFTYDQAQQILNVPDSTDPLASSLHFLYSLSKILRQKRMEAGALTLASPEVRFTLAGENRSEPTDVEVKQMQGANMLVEEFMLLANISVAERIYRSFPDHSLLRRHPVPPQSNFDNLCRAINAHFSQTKSPAPSFDPSTNKSLSISLDLLSDPNDSYFNTLVRILTTRCMMQAVYFVSGNVPYPDFYHYGLATGIYTHFTSPIRRYADVIVHRLLSSALALEQATKDRTIPDTSSYSLNKSSLTQLCDNLNFRHRMAQYASRASIELFTCIYFRTKLETGPLQEDAYVVKVCKNGFVALVPKYGIEGLVDLSKDLEQGILHFDPENFVLTSSTDSDWSVSLFQSVRVEVTVTQVNQRTKVRMHLLTGDKTLT